MFTTVDGEIFTIESDNMDEFWPVAKEFFLDEAHMNDLIAVQGFKENVIYLNYNDVQKDDIEFTDSVLKLSEDLFRVARRNMHILKGGPVPVIDESGSPVLLMKLLEDKAYFHQYEEVTAPPDSRVFDLYDTVVLIGVTEYGYILLKDALREYKGNVVCVGDDWNLFLNYVGQWDNVTIISNISQLPQNVAEGNTMFLAEFLSIMAGHQDRCEKGFFSYDEIMTLVYFFSYLQKSDDSGKKYYLVNPIFPIEGLMAICDKLQDPYAYAEANGYIPVVKITNSNSSMYSDFNGDDIWGKFFNQPYGNEAEDWENQGSVYTFPKAYTSYPDRWLMKRICPSMKDYCFSSTEFINDKVKGEADAVAKNLLADPEHTIGVLIRGTDFTVSHLAGHTIMASPEQVMGKITELEEKGDYRYIFLSTEDEDVLEKMKGLCGDRLIYTNQKRYRIKGGELLSHIKSERENDGWNRGLEYLITLSLLTKCASFVASGVCAGTNSVLNTPNTGFKDCYVFDLGRY